MSHSKIAKSKLVTYICQGFAEQYWKDLCIHEKDKDKIDQMYNTIQAKGRETICAKMVPKICWTCSLCHPRSQSLVLTHVARNSWKCKIMYSFFADHFLAWMGREGKQI